MTVAVMATGTIAIALALFAPQRRSGSARVDGYRVVHTYPHDRDAFTQGLIVRDGYFYEGTGLVGRSGLRKVKIDTFQGKCQTVPPDLKCLIPEMDEMVAKYRHRGLSAALGSPTIAYAEGRCVGGSTEINSGLWHRLPPYLADEWRHTYRIDEFGPETLDRYAEGVERELSVSRVPGAPPPSSAVLERGATKLGWRNVEFSRVFRYDTNGRGVKQTMTRTLLPSALDAGASLIADCSVTRLLRKGDQIVGARCRRRHAGGAVEHVTIHAASPPQARHKTTRPDRSSRSLPGVVASSS